MHFAHNKHNILFCDYDGFSVLENQRKQLLNEIAGLPEQRLLNTSIEDLVKYLVEKHQIEIPVLDIDHAVADQNEAPVEIPDIWDRGQNRSVVGTRVTLEIPFTGDAQMFKVRPSSYNTAPPYAEIRGQLVILTQSGTQLGTEQVQAGFDRAIAEINKYLDWQRKDAKQLNEQLPALARQAIDQRRDKLLANQNLVSGLKFKLKERADAPRTYTVPMQRKRIEAHLNLEWVTRREG